MTPAVIVLDMLHDFVTGALANPRAVPVVGRIRALTEAARAAGRPVVYVNDAHLPGDFEERIWGPHARAGTPGAQVVEELAPRAEDITLTKRVYSGFHETGLDATLRARGVDTVILTGVLTDICVRHTAADALYRGYDIVVPPDAVEALSQEAHDDGLTYLSMAYGARLTPVDELVEALGAPLPSGGR
jgi:nicotinamidase-related amidase